MQVSRRCRTASTSACLRSRRPVSATKPERRESWRRRRSGCLPRGSTGSVSTPSARSSSRGFPNRSRRSPSRGRGSRTRLPASGAGRCRHCSARHHEQPSWVATSSARSWSARGVPCVRGPSRWCWSPGSPGSARADCRRSQPTARTAKGSPSCGARARRSWRCRTNPGSPCARSWSSTPRSSSSNGTLGATAASLGA